MCPSPEWQSHAEGICAKASEHPAALLLVPGRPSFPPASEARLQFSCYEGSGLEQPPSVPVSLPHPRPLPELGRLGEVRAAPGPARNDWTLVEPSRGGRQPRAVGTYLPTVYRWKVTPWGCRGDPKGGGSFLPLLVHVHVPVSKAARLLRL